MTLWITLVLGCGGATRPAQPREDVSGPYLTTEGPLQVRPVSVENLGTRPAPPGVRHTLRIDRGIAHGVCGSVEARAVIGDRRFSARIIRSYRTSSLLVVDLPPDLDARDIVVHLLPSTVIARVVRVTRGDERSTIIVDKGTSHGLHARIPASFAMGRTIIAPTVTRMDAHETELTTTLQVPPDVRTVAFGVVTPPC